MLQGVKNTFLKIICTTLVVAFLVTPTITNASEYTRSNFLFSYHYKPVSFTQLDQGGFTGTLTNGDRFSQLPVVTDSNVRLQRFTVGGAHFYIYERGTFQASNDLVALSIYSYLTNVS